MSTKTGPSHASGSRYRPVGKSAGGFTLIELSIIIVIVGIILGAGTMAWNAVADGRRLAKAQVNLREVRDCLVRRMFYNNTYPSYTGDNTPADLTDNLSCDAAGGAEEDVDTCLCNAFDPWGHNMFYVEGVSSDPTHEPLSQDTKYASDNAAQGVNATTPDRTVSTIVDMNGNNVNYVVFVLISAGKDGLLDDSSYRDLFDTTGGTTLASDVSSHAAPMDTATPPNFDRDIPPDYTVNWTVQGDDDIYLYLTAPELRTLLAE